MHRHDQRRAYRSSGEIKAPSLAGLKLLIRWVLGVLSHGDSHLHSRGLETDHECEGPTRLTAIPGEQGMCTSSDSLPN